MPLAYNNSNAEGMRLTPAAGEKELEEFTFENLAFTD